MATMISIKTSQVDFDQSVITHIEGGGEGDYVTICGLALDGDIFSGTRVKTPKGAKVSCNACHSIWLSCQGFSVKNFEVKP